jgi:hypothetical protein
MVARKTACPPSPVPISGTGSASISSCRGIWRTGRRRTLNLTGYGIFNTSLCKADDRYVLMFEVGKLPWGNQRGIEHLAEAVFDGTEEQFLKGWYSEA